MLNYMFRKKILLFVGLFLIFAKISAQEKAFLQDPYLQIGNNPSPKTLQLLWQTADTNSIWSVEHNENGNWLKNEAPQITKIEILGIITHYVYRSAFTNLNPGNIFAYRVLKNDKIVFNANGKALKSFDQPNRFVVFGDIGAGTTEAKQIANGVFNAKPDLVLVPGDIVYDNGTISDYNKVFWPIYNANSVDSVGVPLMRNVPFVAAVGNHDAESRDLDAKPDALAYYHYWDQPLNGPFSIEGGPVIPVLKGSDVNKKAFLEGAGARYPVMSNFSFNNGNAHWTVLDADTYVDWTNKDLLDWVAKDLENSQDAVWHFVLYHHPGFNSSIEHYEQQQMRLLATIFEKGKVDIVFNGHVHNYQRSFPLTFNPFNRGTLMVGGKEGKSIRGRVVPGSWKLDHNFDGKNNKKPNGVIYIITGAGGQTLYNPEQQDDSDSWQKFTDKFISKVHTLTVVDINGKTLKLSQQTADGKELDAIEITK